MDFTLASDYERIIRILSRQLKRGGPSNFEEVCGHWMDPEQKKLYLSIVNSGKPACPMCDDIKSIPIRRVVGRKVVIERTPCPGCTK